MNAGGTLNIYVIKSTRSTWLLQLQTFSSLSQRKPGLNKFTMNGREVCRDKSNLVGDSSKILLERMLDESFWIFNIVEVKFP